MNKNVEIVVAHYCEDMERLKPYAKNAIVYHKWNEDKPRFPVKKRVKLENVWRESHTYLYHIVNNYNNLAQYNIFFQWWVKDHEDVWWVYSSVNNYIREIKFNGFSCPKLFPLVRKEPQIVFNWKFKEAVENWSLERSSLNFSQFYEKLFWKKQPFIICSFYAANFGVSRDVIKKHPLSFYKNALNLLPTVCNPEEWHYYERL